MEILQFDIVYIMFQNNVVKICSKFMIPEISITVFVNL